MCLTNTMILCDVTVKVLDCFRHLPWEENTFTNSIKANLELYTETLHHRSAGALNESFTPQKSNNTAACTLPYKQSLLEETSSLHIVSGTQQAGGRFNIL